MKYLLILFLLLIPLDAHGQATKETLYLKDQISDLQKEVKELWKLGLKSVLLFVKVDDKLKDNSGKEALNAEFKKTSV